jgi:DNA-binding beta-propeller fold protein YncE
MMAEKEGIMENMVSRKYPGGCRVIFLVLILGILLLSKVDSTYAVDCTPPGTCPEIASGLSAAVGAAIDESKNQLYFVEYNPPGNGTLKRINLPPQCGPGTLVPSCSTTIVPIATGFSHPEDVQLDLAHGFAYVTTRDDLGTTGALWKVDISNISACSPNCPKSMITFNLGAPQQLVLDTANNQAFVVGFDDGRLRRIDLTTGVKTSIFKGLGHPVGLAITKDRKFAYVTEQDAPARISKIDLTLGIKVGEVIKDGISGVSLVAPFFLAWTDNSQNSLYVVERDPANRVSRIDLITSTKYEVVTGLPWRPSGIVVSSVGTPIYVTTDSTIVKVDMIDMGELLKEPIFIKVGFVPATEINDDGYVKNDIVNFPHIKKHAPFGGTLDIFGNFNKFKELGAKYYQVQVKKDGGTFSSLNLSWNDYKWNPIKGEYEPVPVAPDPNAPNPAAGTKYKIPDEYPLNAAWWVNPFLMMRWPSGENGLYEFTVKIFDASGNDITGNFQPNWKNSLKVQIDNTPPDVKILSIWQVVGTLDTKPPDPADTGPDKEIKPCDIVSTGANKYYFKITAYDTNQHLLSYGLSALWGDNKSETIYADSYDNHVVPAPPHPWSGVTNFIVPRDVPGSVGNPTTWPAKCNCAHTFYLGAWKRTINGYWHILYRDYHKSITINNVTKNGTPVTCGLEQCGFPCP